MSSRSTSRTTSRIDLTRHILLPGLRAFVSNSALSGGSHSWQNRLPQPDHEVAVRIDVRVPMGDGVKLSADVYLPDKWGEWPVILERTPYDNSRYFYVNRARYFARRGYAHVVQDCRGRNDAGGKWYAWSYEINNGGAPGIDPEIVVATQRVYHDRRHPSHILWPVIPPEDPE